MFNPAMFNPADLSPSPAPDHRCRYVKVNGARCRLPAKPASDLCADHHFKKTYTRGRIRPDPPASFNTVPLVRFAWADDHDSILFNCNQIALALVHDTISAHHAGALNALMHTCQRSLRQKFLHERFEASERERSATAGPQTSPEPNPDIVTDYVLDIDGMPLALPDEPIPASDNPGAPCNPEVGLSGENDPLAAPCNPGAPCKPEVGLSGENDLTFKDEKENNPAWIEQQRDAVLYLREYYKEDPKMLAEIETYPGARYAPKPKYEPWPEPETSTLPALTAAADPTPQPASRPVTPVPSIKWPQPQHLPHIRTEALSKCPVWHT